MTHENLGPGSKGKLKIDLTLTATSPVLYAGTKLKALSAPREVPMGLVIDVHVHGSGENVGTIFVDQVDWD